MKLLLKRLIQFVCVIAVLPFAILSAFGRLRPAFVMGAQLVSMAPGIPGDYLRGAYYWLTLRKCALDSRISFGTFFSTSDVVVEQNAYIGSYCVIGRARIGAHTQVASHVQIPSGAKQHARDAQGNLQGGETGIFQPIAIGAHVWIGAGAIVMANIGDGVTIGAGSVVTKEIPPGVVAMGNPATIRTS